MEHNRFSRANIWNRSIRVVPADATASSLSITPSEDVYVAGEAYELLHLGQMSEVFRLITPPITNFTVSSGTHSQENGRVFWTPMTMGNPYYNG